MQEGRDVWYGDEMAKVDTECEAEPMNAEDMLFILYTSGSTGKPKGVVHTTGGYLMHTSLSHKLIFDVHDDDIYWCTADIGWVTGHSYIVYGPLANGATSLMFEGVPTYPDAGRFWQICDKFGVTVFYTAPTALRALMRLGDDWPAKYKLDSLRSARHGRRTDQPRGLDVVLRPHWTRALPDRRHLVADGDRWLHDHAASRVHTP